MRKLTTLILIVVSSISASAQFHYPDSRNPEILRHSNRRLPSRKEIVLPQVGKYNVYKSDLHTHTLFSDGNVLPDYRIKEAWLDGLDVIALTEHLEYRPHEETLSEYMEHYIEGSGKKVKNNRIVGTEPDTDGILVDLNYSYNRAMKWAPEFGITVIKGIEISRNGETIGHYNALFTLDNNTIYDPDPIKAIRNAKSQGALVMHNHPGWRKTSIDYTETDKAAYGAGLIDGVEVMNEGEFYPGIIDRATKHNLFMAGCSDIHSSTASEYGLEGNYRPMTFILAEDLSLASLKDALEKGRTIAYGFGTLCSTEQILTDFFKASVSIKVVNERNARGETVIWLTNNTSLPYQLSLGGSELEYLAPFASLLIKKKTTDRSVHVEVANMFYARDKHPTVTLKY
jgi:predicted metal-dependent phosphoesterase TrpH